MDAADLTSKEIWGGTIVVGVIIGLAYMIGAMAGLAFTVGAVAGLAWMSGNWVGSLLTKVMFSPSFKFPFLSIGAV
jgi:hypothetical protein